MFSPRPKYRCVASMIPGKIAMFSSLIKVPMLRVDGTIQYFSVSTAARRLAVRRLIVRATCRARDSLHALLHVKHIQRCTLKKAFRGQCSYHYFTRNLFFVELEGRPKGFFFLEIGGGSLKIKLP